MALKHVYYHLWNELPVQVQCMKQDARGWCTWMTQRDRMGREVGGVFRMGNTCTPVADPGPCMAKPLQYCKKKKSKSKESPWLSRTLRTSLKSVSLPVTTILQRAVLLAGLIGCDCYCRSRKEYKAQGQHTKRKGKNDHISNRKTRTSLVEEWIGIHLQMQATWVRSLIHVVEQLSL